MVFVLMKHLIRLAISVSFPLFIFSGNIDRVASQELIADGRSNITDICRQIRQVRRLAIREGLDNRNIATLEDRYCATAQPPTNNIMPPANATQDCIDLTIITRLARIARDDSNLINLVGNQQLISCQFSTQWEKSSLSYPNGQTAKFGSTWSYPNGQTAKFGSNWHYPNGNFADFESLLAWACSILGRDECADRLLEVRNTNDFWSELAMIELSWQAYTLGK